MIIGTIPMITRITVMRNRRLRRNFHFIFFLKLSLEIITHSPLRMYVFRFARIRFNPNKVYSRENLLNIVWGYEYPGDVRTVDVHIRRLREKIEPNPSEPKYVHTKWGVGYYFQG